MRGAPLERVEASAYVVPTDQPEADGTMAWDHTTLVVAEVSAGGETGIGYTYADACIVSLITGVLGKAVQRHDAMDPPKAWRAMQRAVRNIGREGLAATAIAAVDTAIWDLKAKLLRVPLALLFGAHARCGTDLRQRRLHQLQRRRASPNSCLPGCSAMAAAG